MTLYGSKYIIRLLGLCLMIFSAFSCTYDYFEDENNFRLYVPQIEDKSIQNFYVSFHDKTTGKHVLTRKLTTPFNQDDSRVENGILRFKLNPGEYTITCFADYTPNTITEGIAYAGSHQFKTACDKNLWPMDYGDDMFQSRSTHPRMMHFDAMVYPMGHTNAETAVTADINSDQRFKGEIYIDFQGLPNGVERIDVLYKGLGTKFQFDGYFERNCDNDKIYATYSNLAPYRNGDIISLPADPIYTSVGTCYRGTAHATCQPVELQIYFYGQNNTVVGEATFTKAMFDAMPVADKPKDENNQPMQELILHPQKAIKFKFKGFLIVGIDLMEWGDTNQGIPTPV